MASSRKKRVVISVVLMSLVAGGTVLGLYGCQEPERVTGTIRPADDRDRKLVALAAEEAGLFEDVDAGLTRQLNLANEQLRRGWTADAPVTLKGARDRLLGKDASKLSIHARLSGWVSISELSRAARDTTSASNACDQAIKELESYGNQAARCKYVMGIANEAQFLKGLPAAKNLLVSAGGWAREIGDKNERRTALTTFASALFNLDEYTAGQTVMRQDPDASWRSETLSALASAANPENTEPRAATAVAHAVREHASDERVAERRSIQPSGSYGVPLNYQSVFRGKERSATVKPEEPKK